MKKLILALVVAMGFFAADAQTTKKSKKSKKSSVSKESKAKAKEKAELARIQKETDEKIAQFRSDSFVADSMRIDSERVARENFEMERKAFMETRLREMDSTNKDNWKRISIQKEQWAKTEHQIDEVNRAAKLGTYESRQVKYINQSYIEKARLIRENTEIADDEKKKQLATLNAERRSSIKAVIGKSKEKKLEKERKEYAKKYGEDSEAKWISEAEGYAVNK